MKIKGIELSAFFKPKNWMSWLRGMIIGSDLKQEYIEQVMFRMTNENCRPCLEKGKCIGIGRDGKVCGCNTYKKMLDPHAECHGVDNEGYPYWGEMLNKKAWNEYKEFVGLEFKNTRTKEKEASILKEENN